MSLISELKARNIWSALAVFLGGGWVVIEAFNFLSEKYSWSNSVIDIIILVVIFGLPTVLIHSWHHGKPGKKVYKRREFVLHGANGLLFLTIAYRVLFFASAPPSVEVDSPRSIAVIPFKNESSDDENEYFAAGAMTAIFNHLARIKDIDLLVDPQSAKKYKETDLSSAEIANALGVKYLITGGVQKSGNIVRVSVQLIDAEAGETIWSEDYDRELLNILKYKARLP